MLSRDACTQNVRYAHMEWVSTVQPQYIIFLLKKSRLIRPASWESFVDYFRLLFAYTDLHVPRTGKLEARGGSV